MKTCINCKKEKELFEFNKRTNSKDGHDPRCRSCTKQRDLIRYKKNSELFKQRAKIKNNQIRDRNREFIINYLLDKKCIDCGESDPIVLEFDHINPSEKLNCISELLPRVSIDTLKKELKKCEVRCANCHRRKTAKQFNWRLKY